VFHHHVVVAARRALRVLLLRLVVVVRILRRSCRHMRTVAVRSVDKEMARF
jgi:hypothetical protein